MAFDLNHALPADAPSDAASFQGLVMVDAEGYPVWYHNAGAQARARGLVGEEDAREEVVGEQPEFAQ